MRRLITGFILGTLFICNISFAYRVAKPIPINEVNPTTLVELNSVLEKIWDITNGRYSLDIMTSAPSGVGTEGDLKAYVSGGLYKLWSYLSGAWRIIGQADRTIQATIMQPDDLDEADDIVIWSNETGFTFNITEIKAWCDDQAGDDGDFTLVEITDPTDFTAETTIEAVTCSTDGTEVDYTTVAEADIDHKAIEDTHLIVLDPTTDDLEWVKITISGYLGN